MDSQSDSEGFRSRQTKSSVGLVCWERPLDPVGNAIFALFGLVRG
jgi:hypothetical protein